MTSPNGVRFVSCDGCSLDEKHSVGSHPRCFDLIAPQDYVPLLRVAKMSYRPIIPDGRERRLRHQLASRLVTTLRLLSEVTTEIAQYLTQEYAVAALSSLVPIRRPGVVHLDVSAPIVLQRSQFEGLLYISSASNAEGPKSQERPRRLFLSEDEFGITSLHVTASESPPSVKQSLGVWWKTVVLRDDQTMVRLYHDVLTSWPSMP